LGDAPAIDVHQHLWPAAFVTALRARREPPRLRGWTLDLAGQPAEAIDPAWHEPSARAAEARADGLDLALVSLSSPLGIEFLPADEANDLLAAYHDGALALPAPFGAWAAACMTDVDPAAVERELERGFVGLQLPATALLDDSGYERARPLLDRLERADKPLLIHPGPASPAAYGDPAWWPALVSYVQQMHAAWFAFRVHGRPHHARLRVCFAMLAGLAPLHSERFATRSGLRSVIDDGVFLDISSYGTRAVDAVLRVLGVDGLVNGSDRPYAAPVDHELGVSVQNAIRAVNPLRLLALDKEVSDDLAVASCAQS
jgi:6-methylsalicylate decarboxylase